MLSFEINKQIRIATSKRRLEQIAASFVVETKIKKNRHFSLAFVDAKTIKKLNQQYRGQDCVTDVLSFAEELSDPINQIVDREYIGEIIICVSQAKKQAKDLRCGLENEVTRLLIHGLAHLIGYDHEGVSQKEAAKMLLLEKRVLERLGLWEIFEFEAE